MDLDLQNSVRVFRGSSEIKAVRADVELGKAPRGAGVSDFQGFGLGFRV